MTEFRALNPVNGKRPDLRIRGLVEKNILIDATFGDPRCKSHIDHSNSTHVQGGTVERLCKSKIAKYGQHCDDINAIFHPAAFEIFGSTSHETEELIAKARATFPIQIISLTGEREFPPQSNGGIIYICHVRTQRFWVGCIVYNLLLQKCSFRMSSVSLSICVTSLYLVCKLLTGLHVHAIHYPVCVLNICMISLFIV